MTGEPKPFSNPSSQSERQRILAEERQRLRAPPAPTTYHSLANVDLELGGRFAKESAVSGEAASVNYPALPAGSPWSGDPTGVEPPTNYEIDACEAVGTAEEIERSLARSVGSSASAPAMDRAVLPGEGSSPLLETTTTRPSTTGAAALRMRRLR